MRFAALISHLRLSRLHRCVLLWLVWFADFLEAASMLGPLSQQARAIAHDWLNTIERRIFTIIILRGARRLAPVVQRFYGPGQRRGAMLRAMMGSRLRRRLRAKDICARAAALTQDIGVLVELYVRRICRGLTRLSGTRTRRRAHAALPVVLDAAACLAADTS